MRNKINSKVSINGNAPDRVGQEGTVFIIDYDVPQKNGTKKDIYHVAFGRNAIAIDDTMFSVVSLERRE